MALKLRQRAKDKSRIPSVSVGEEVDTSLGEKKKVCFNIGLKWIFRMVVNPDWRAKKGRKAAGMAA